MIISNIHSDLTKLHYSDRSLKMKFSLMPKPKIIELKTWKTKQNLYYAYNFDKSKYK